MRIPKFLIAFILILAILNLNSISVAQSKVMIKEGTKLKYKVTIFENNSETTEIKEIQITKITVSQAKTNITWTSNNEKGSWIAESFGPLVINPGEKWETTNIAFYETVVKYEMMLKNKAPTPNANVYFDFYMEFFYWKVFKNLPRQGKTYEFYGHVSPMKNYYYYIIVHKVSYFSNGVAYYIYYEESIDTNGDLNVSDEERHYEEWQLIDWNLPFNAAISVIVTTLFYILLLIVVVYFLRVIIRKYTPKLYAE